MLLHNAQAAWRDSWAAVLLICNVAAICTVAYTKGYRHLVQLRKHHAAASADAEELAVSAISDIAVLAAVATVAAALATAASGLWVSVYTTTEHSSLSST
jgi:hypothetical protein